MKKRSSGVVGTMTTARPSYPLAEALYKIRQKKNASDDELAATLEWAQLETEKSWESGEVLKLIGSVQAETRTCDYPGCNYSRYPASKKCMYHVTGHDTFAARHRQAQAKKNPR